MAVGAGLFVGLNQWYSPAAKAWLLLVIALGRTVCDYAFCWSFYFPKDAGRSSRSSVARPLHDS
jgi:hypothetical protein